MKVIPFQIPRSGNSSINIQVETVPHLYNHLHQHPEIQVTLISQSSGTLIAGDYVGRFEAGDVFVIGSNQPHVFRNDAVFFRKKRIAVSITLFFDENTLGKEFWLQAELASLQPFFSNSQFGYRVQGSKQLEMQSLLISLKDATGLKKLSLFIQLLHLLNSERELVSLSKTHPQRTIKSFDGSRLNRIIAYTFKESHRSLMLDEIAGIANMTVEAFCKYFKTRTGKTYISFLNEIRISNACKFLLLEDKTITEICYESGFSNLSNFNRVFKKITGKTPKEYRMAINNGFDQITSPSRS